MYSLNYKHLIGIGFMAIFFLSGCVSNNGLMPNHTWCDNQNNCSKKADVLEIATNKNVFLSALAAGTIVNGKRLKTNDATLYLVKLRENKYYNGYGLSFNHLYLGVTTTMYKNNYLSNQMKIFTNTEIINAKCFSQLKYSRKQILERVCQLDKEAINLLSSGNASVKIDIQNSTPVVFKLDAKDVVKNIKHIAINTYNQSSHNIYTTNKSNNFLNSSHKCNI